MAGRPYSNSEMKKIVDYLVEHKAYGQLRGRKMWVEFADSKRVNRTWQSLKEVFLKRILNNIQDPYFKLTTYQIASFKRGYDVQAKISDRLHYVNVDTDIDENTGENVDKETSNGHNNDNASTVADHRTSTETLVLDNSCDCVEDLPRALEEYEGEDSLQMNTNKAQKSDETSTKSKGQALVQSVIEDFHSDDEGSNIESNKEQNSNNINANEASDLITSNNLKVTPNIANIGENIDNIDVITKEITTTILNTNKNQIVLDGSNSDESNAEGDDNMARTDNHSNLTNETSLPNNPEGFHKYKSKTNDGENNKTKVDSVKKNDRKRRACSQDVFITNSRKITSQLSMSDSNLNKKAKIMEGGIKFDILPNKTVSNSDIIRNDVEVINPASKGQVENNSTTKKNMPEIENPCLRSISLYDEQLACTSSNYEECNRDELIGKRKRRNNNRKYATRIIDISSDSSGNSTEDEDDSSSRGRSNRPSKRYIKPKLARKMTRDDDGLFLVRDKKKGGKSSKTNGSNEEAESRSSYWMLKYVEEKKKADELAKVVKDLQRGSCNTDARATTSSYTRPSTVQGRVSNDNDHRFDVPNVPEPKCSSPAEEIQPVKMIFKNGGVEVVGPWTILNPLFDQYMKKLKEDRDTENKKEEQRASGENEAVITIGNTSRQNEVAGDRSKILEDEIFKEIQIRDSEDTDDTDETEIGQQVKGHIEEQKQRERDIEEEQQGKGAIEEQQQGKERIEEQQQGNGDIEEQQQGTGDIEQQQGKGDIEEQQQAKEDIEQQQQQSKGKQRKSTKARKNSEQSTPLIRKKNKLSIEKQAEPDTSNATPKRKSTRASGKIANENTKASLDNVTIRKNTRRSNSVSSTNVEEDETEIRYKFPSPPPDTRRQRTNNSSTISQGVQTSLENLSINEESTQGYLDTDTSPIITQRKKKRAKTISRKVDTHYRLRKRCKSPAESSSDSNLSYFTARPPHRADSHSSLSSRIYKSESYQQLMPTKSSSPRRLDQIVECENDFYAIENSIECTEINCNTKEGSSNISLPTSPVLSVVENISISRSLIDDNNLNESSVKETDTVILNQLMSCGDDVSMPLMEQNLELDRRSENGSQSNYTINMAENSVSDSFLNKICSVQLEDLKFSESISAKLRDLLLESAKKLVTEIKTNKDKENTESKFQVSNFIPEKKRKRSSTPRRSERISNPISTDAVVEKEHRESCSKLNRESCPPVICVRDNFDKEIPPDITETPARKNGRGRKKKDIIKVKITRPRSADSLKKISDDLYPTHFENNTPKDDIFTNNDTESGIFLQGLNDSMDLVHNHSETCLQDHECIDSVEAVSNPAIPTVLIDSESFTSDVLQNDSKINDDLMGLEFLGSNAQDGTDYMEAFKCSVSTTTVQHEVAAGNHTPNSIITEDLTGDSTPKSCKWYLLSEDETKTDFQVLPNYVETSPSYGADLNQIFPLTCAIPNLSTITEMSKDNEDTSPNILTHFAIPN
ncbi:uncharacterized protein LOC126977914 isoform X2 [Leptidea sinapis]|uniref:uncharacterized protein LOC126977914 isoform X2 n=1 Tax=Leptidea sinapis TaxID=189913 RepID=UPI0021C39FB9|nr:uncharacterized protein LOC126977914 isoform X2 [Leptidea sinapis]